MSAGDAANLVAAFGLMMLVAAVIVLAALVWFSHARCNAVERITDAVRLAERLHQIELQCTELSAKVACLMRRNDRLL